MIFSIQRCSAHDGPGVRMVVLLKGCSLGCRWCQNPGSHTRTQDLLYNPQLCLKGCRLCAKTAPGVIRPALNGLFTHREELTPERFTALTGCCPAQALTVCDEVKNAEEIMATALRDKPFYDRSGGGLVLSGGEPFMQPEMAMGLLQVNHEAGIHTAVETCLHVPWEYIIPSLSYIDLFPTDLRYVADASFEQWTNGNAARVLDNLKKLATAGKEIVIRVPLIQGFNANETSVKTIIDFTTDELHVSGVHFLPYHTLGINKYHLLNLPYDAPEKSFDAPKLLDFAQQYACREGLVAILRG